MELFLIRHLPTEWNKKGLLQGSRDISIDPIVEPEQQMNIAKNIEKIKLFKPELTLASQLKRTHQTAEQYGYTSYVTDPLLNELNFGDYEGKDKKYLINTAGWIDHPRNLTLGERMIDFENRLLTFIDKYKNYSRILVFGHGAWIRGMVSISETGNINMMNQFTVENNTVQYLDLSTILAERADRS
ncbi:histidine phosphatase family protein [Bacillus sp. Marseille-P3661]|uniref:histidine phosphatase family protein n=1 Tax=Bacillus sp. Marseille-P3661 TaxID=1936234 RepID=UPI000C82B3C6|nr:phosphoglycerate mutase family protein [Bacillus sp. Marseille-P3661]